MLEPYRVLDLTDEKGVFCGKLLADLGADVIKIEKPGGDSCRNIGPFYHDEIHPEKSLFWFAFNTGKRGITLDVKRLDGQNLFKKLVVSADLVIESFPPGCLDCLGIGYSDIEKLKPSIIMASISPFGQTGPYKNYKTSDIVSWAMGGEMYVSGDVDHPPIRVGYHSQSYLHASVEAASGAIAALYYRLTHGVGQHVDISIQECVTRVSSQGTTMPWDALRVIPRRGQNWERSGTWFYPNIKQTHLWQCKDSYVVFSLASGIYAKRRNPPLIEWMDSKGMADDFLKKFDWDNFDFRKTNQEIVDRLEEPIRKFFLSCTKKEILEEAIKRRVLVYPVSNADDTLTNSQLSARGFWVDVEHPELDDTIKYPGPFFQSSVTSPKILRRAPLIGEHNIEVYERELGISRDKLVMLKQAGVI